MRDLHEHLVQGREDLARLHFDTLLFRHQSLLSSRAVYWHQEVSDGAERRSRRKRAHGMHAEGRRGGLQLSMIRKIMEKLRLQVLWGSRDLEPQGMEPQGMEPQGNLNPWGAS